MKSSYFRLSIFLSLFFSVCQSPIAISAESDTDGRPGETDPVTTSRQTLFRDDEVMLFMGRPDEHKMHYLYATPEKNDLTSWQEYGEEHLYDSDKFGPLLNEDMKPIASARGRTIDHEHDYVVYAFFRPDGKVTVEQYNPKARVDGGVGRRAAWNTFTGSTLHYRSVDLALGDLDGLSDEDGWYHDEIVLVRTHSGGVYADVIGHDKNLTSLASELIPFSLTPYYTSVDIGDLNGDGVLEFVVGMFKYQGDYKLAVYNYSEKDGLVLASTYSAITNYGGGFDLTVGDFDGDGKDDVLVATGDAGNHMDILRADEDLKLHLAYHRLNALSGLSSSLRVVSGLFRFDGAGWGLSRRQPIVCYGYYNAQCVTCTLYEMGSDMSLHGYDEIAWCLKAPDWGDTPCSGFNCSNYEISSLDVTTGNFVGHGTDKKQRSPMMDLAISTVEIKSDEYHHPRKIRPAMRVLSNRSGGLEERWSWGGDQYDFDPDRYKYLQLATTVSAADGDGDTYRLGSPAHIVMDNVLRIDRIIQEPPKHVDYLPTNPDDLDEDQWVWEVINVSGYSDFAVSLHDETNETLETKTISNSGWDIGGGVSLDAKSTVTAGNMDIAGVSVSAEIKDKLGYDYKENESSYNSHYASKTYTEDTATETDDIVQGVTRTIDIWRYPILGYYEADNDKPYGYQEIVMPGNNINVDKSAGRDHPDWYQPFHENHNLLSYPFHDMSLRWKPKDLGSFNIGGSDMKVVMNEDILMHWDGNRFDMGINWSDTAGAGSEKDYKNTLSQSSELTISYEAKAKILIGSTDEQFTGKVSFHDSVSWGGKTVSTATNSKSTGIHIGFQLEDNPSSSTYEFKPAAYITSTGGTFKIAYAVGLPQADWWREQYGRKPDPALNLPIRLKWHQADQAHGNTEYWYLNTDESKHNMRGFFLRESKIDPDTKSYPLLSSAIVDGDLVRLCARVYNYSLSEPTGEFRVRFSYYPWDIEEARQIADPVSDPSMVVIANLDALETGGGTPMKEYCVEWDTTGLSTRFTYNDAYINTFRFQVMLDEDDEVDEIHELYDDKGNEVLGSNNIGTYPWMNAVTVSQKPTESQDNAGLDKNDLRIVKDSMAIKMGDDMVRAEESGKPLQLELGKSYEIRALVEADENHPFHRFLFLYDGPPDGKEKGERKGHPAGNGKGNPSGKGKVLASSRLFGIEAESQYAWIRWTPNTLGKQEIWMRLLEDVDEVNKGNAVNSLEVIVVPAKKERKKPKKTE